MQLGKSTEHNGEIGISAKITTTLSTQPWQAHMKVNFFYKEPVVFIIAGVLGRGGKEEQKRIQHVVKQFVDFCACEVVVLHRVYLRTSPQHFSPSRNLNNLKRRKPFILIKV